MPVLHPDLTVWCRSLALLIVLGFGLTQPIAGQQAWAAEPYTARHEQVLGTSLDLVIHADDAEVIEQAEATVLAEIDRLAAILSTWDASSEFRRWHGAPPAPRAASPELFEVLSLCDLWKTTSGGAFNPSAQAICALWKAGAQTGQAPGDNLLKQAVQQAAAPAWKLSAENHTALRLNDCPVTLDALAKGYIVEQATVTTLRRLPQVRGLVVAIGGETRVAGDIDHEIRITNPFADADNAPSIARVTLRNRALGTSGGYRRGVHIAGRWYSHIVDPRTGQPVDHIASSTAIANTTADADALATIFSVLPVAESLALADRLPGVACLLVTRDGTRITSQNWQQLTTVSNAGARDTTLAAVTPTEDRQAESTPAAEKDQKEDATDTDGGAAWDEDFEMLVQF
ncbi:MAG: FAD:protein FMN transferase, partial [Planctomycetes bacterium]|nr:FAD:protein FMN transferase [Planctomycetota bacterium]